MKILIVDDEPELREVFADRLRLKGAEVFEAENGEEAIKILKESAFDGVVTDLRMPKLDGRGVLKFTKEKGIMTVVITGYSDYPDEELIKLGAKLVLKKPIDFSALISALGLN